MSEYEEWVEQLANCERRSTADYGHLYPGEKGQVHSLACGCPKCESWREADRLRAAFRRSMGFRD
jgi:hypothetical protein